MPRPLDGAGLAGAEKSFVGDSRDLRNLSIMAFRDDWQQQTTD